MKCDLCGISVLSDSEYTVVEKDDLKITLCSLCVRDLEQLIKIEEIWKQEAENDETNQHK